MFLKWCYLLFYDFLVTWLDAFTIIFPALLEHSSFANKITASNAWLMAFCDRHPSEPRLDVASPCNNVTDQLPHTFHYKLLSPKSNEFAIYFDVHYII